MAQPHNLTALVSFIVEIDVLPLMLLEWYWRGIRPTEVVKLKDVLEITPKEREMDAITQYEYIKRDAWNVILKT